MQQDPPIFHDFGGDFEAWAANHPEAARHSFEQHGTRLTRLVSVFNPTDNLVRFDVHLGHPKAWATSPAVRKQFRDENLNVRVTVKPAETLRIPRPWADVAVVVRDGVVVSGEAPMLKILDTAGADATPPVHRSIEAGFPKFVHKPVPRVRRVQ